MKATCPGDASASARNGSASDGWPLPWTISRARRSSEQVGRGVGEQVEALLRVEPADHPDDRARRRPDRTRLRVSRSARQAALPARSPREYGAAEVRVGGRVPDVVSSPLRIPRNRSPRGRSSAIEAHPERRRQRLRRVARRHRVDELGRLDAGRAAGRCRRRSARDPRRPAAARARAGPRWASSRGTRGCGGS